MTATTGGRGSRTVRTSTAASAARSVEGVLPVSDGGTGGSTSGEARANLGVPGLVEDNLFTGTNTFGVVSAGGLVSANDGLNVQGAFVSEETSSLGGPSFAYVAKTGTYSASSTDCIVDCTSGSFTVTLPTAVGVPGRLYVVKNSGAGTITLATTSGQTIDGAAPGTVAAGAVAQLVSNGSNWITI